MAHLTVSELHGLGQDGDEAKRREWVRAHKTPGDDGAAGTVRDVEASNEQIQRVIDQSSTSISFPSLPYRAPRVSPLAASWRFPTGSNLPVPSAGYQPSRWPWVAGALAVLLGGAALYWAFKE